MKILRFEDIVAWQEARILVKQLYSLNNMQLLKDFRFRAQITSCATSVMSNIAEGFSRNTNREFKQYLFIAKGSVAELQSNLYVALDQQYVEENLFNELYKQSDKVARLISKFITYLNSIIKPN